MFTLGEMKQKALALIEELNPDSEYLTDDPDIATKINYVINQVMFEAARIKKIPKYLEMAVTKGQIIDFLHLYEECGKYVYQLGTVKGVEYELVADGMIIKILEDGTAEIDFFVYPERISADTSDGYVFELSQDVLEIMPYGIAADLLKSDISSEYGSVYATRYETMLQRLDTRNSLSSIYIEGGVTI